MKIIALLENSVTDGGGFNQTLSAIHQMQRICKNRFEFEVFTTRPANLAILAALDINAQLFSIGLFAKNLSMVAAMPWWQWIQYRMKRSFVMAFEKALIRQKADLIYFVGPSFLMLPLQKLNYLSTVWDLCHRDTPEFPEVRHFSEFHVRESLFQKTLAPSVLIITDSAMSKENISRRYGIDQDRILSIPFSPSPLLEERYAAGTPEVLARYRIESGYFFYPAQFWSHKNHMRILDALLILQREDWRPVMVFTGGDMGNRKTVEEFIMHNGLTDQVKILGFIPPEDMRGLYSGARAVVMPSYFGPTNLPPLEAWIMGKPLIYSTTGREQAGDAAILFDPDEAKELANALKLTRDDQLCADLIEKGRKRLQEIEVCRNIGEEKLLDRLIQFEKRCRCWGGGKE